MRARGHALVIVLAVLTASTGLVFTFATRLSLDTEQRRVQAGRVEALWLARSAVTAGITGTRTVAVEHGRATVSVVRRGPEVQATAEIPRVGRAVVRATFAGAAASGWVEEFQRAN